MEEFKHLLDPGYAAQTGRDSPSSGGNWLNQVESMGVSSSPSSQHAVATSGGVGMSSEKNKPENAFKSESTFNKSESTFNLFSYVPRAIGTPGELQSVPQSLAISPSFPSLTPALPTVEQPRKTMPPPVFEMPKSHF